MWWYVVATAFVIAGIVYWLRSHKQVQKNDEHQMLSIVALLREPQRLEPIYIASAAKRAWNADLSHGEEGGEGEDGFVVGNDELPTLIVNFRDRMIMVNNFPVPYVEDPKTVADSIPDLRLRGLVGEHTAWLSCDAMGVESFDDAQAVVEWYQILGKLMSELVDDNCLAIFVPETGQGFPNMSETLEMLKSDDPINALGDDAPVPVIPISDNDPRMKAAVAEARQTWPSFVDAFERQAGESFGIKAPITANGNTEFIWITVTALEGGTIYGELANEPMDLGKLELGSRVRVDESDLNDWAYIDTDGQPNGMFTVKVLSDASREQSDDDGEDGS
ncbi:MAG: DUF2314 domain-containing protein [Planctomycetota bacterium]